MTLRDRMRSEDIRRELRVESITTKIRTARLRWYGHVRRMEEGKQLGEESYGNGGGWEESTRKTSAEMD